MRLQNPRMNGSAGVSLHAKLLDQLGQSIVRGDLLPGDPLPNAHDWSAAHGVSRTVLREVIKVPAGKGMVESRPKIGTRIRGRADWNFLDPDVLAWRYGTTTNFTDARSLFELRRAIEPMAGALAAERAEHHAALLINLDSEILAKYGSMRIGGDLDSSSDIHNSRLIRGTIQAHPITGA